MKYFIIATFMVSTALYAQNFIKDSECDTKLKSQEFAMLEGWGQGKISAFTDTDKNNCIKFELVKFATDKNGKKSCNTAIRIGGNNKLNGFACEPDTTYDFSFNIKGTAPRAMINFYEWFDNKSNGYSSRRKHRVKNHIFKVKNEWQTFNGSFKTSKDAKRAALCIQYWGKEATNDLPEKINQYVLIDKIVIKKAAK